MDFPLALLALLPLLHWLVRLIDLGRRRRSPFRVVGGQFPADGDAGAVSVLIPARDEAASIDGCLRSVLAQDHGELEVIVLDDRSSDGTGGIVDRVAGEDPRVRRIEGSPLPEGWKGKTHALQQAAAHAHHPWLAMIDADVHLEPTALSTALGAAQAADAEMVSWFAELETVTFWERVLQPFIFDFILTHSDPARVNDPVRDECIANGQFILVRAEVYRQLGGHGPVRASIVEDMALARRAKAAGVRYRLLDALGVMRTRMYTSLPEILEGWTKNFFAGLHGRWDAVGAALIYLALTSLLPFALLAGLASAWGMGTPLPLALSLAAASVLALLTYRIAVMGRCRPPSVLSIALHPLAAAVLAWIILDSARRAARGVAVTWKGREYDAGGASAELADEPSPALTEGAGRDEQGGER